MIDTNKLPYYPRFIFNCDDGKCMSTGDLEYFRYFKESESKDDINKFKPGQQITINWEDGAELKTYQVDKIEIHRIKYDLDMPTRGMNLNDCAAIDGQEKKWMMEIYIFLKQL